MKRKKKGTLAILVAEADSRRRSNLKYHFRSTDHDVVFAESADQAAAAIAENRHFDGVVISVCIGGKGGVDLARKAHERHPDAAILLFGDVVSEELEKVVREAGARRLIETKGLYEELVSIGFLKKPVAAAQGR